jgi:hypothetical protein
LLETNAVLALVGEVFGLIPFEADSWHYNSVITILQLCKPGRSWSRERSQDGALRWLLESD